MPHWSSFVCTFLFSILTTFALNGQANFREGYERENPAPPSSDLPTEERLAIHQEWIKEAEAENDTLLRIFGEIYLFYDFVRLNDLATASTHIVRAEHLAEAAGDVGWQGGVAFRRGHLHSYMRESEPKLTAVKNALRWCTEAGDSLCVAESLESLSATYSFMDSFDLAHYYFDRALPMIRKFGEKKHLQTAVANYGNLLIEEGRPKESIPYHQEAIELATATQNDISLGRALNNLANAYRLSGNVSRAIEGFKDAIAHNEKIGNYQSVVRNYAGLRQSYQAIGDYKSAIAYQEKYYHLQDSLIGSATKIKIAELETQFLESQQALDLEQSQSALLTSNQRLERRGFILLVFLFAAMVATAVWWRQHQRQRARIVESRKNLAVVTRLLKEKNEAMMELKEAVSFTHSSGQSAEESSPDPDDPKNHLSLFNQTILTETDWMDFKAYFDDSFPGYVQRLRTAFPALTEAEERLFLLLKLNLTSKEISNILGISASGVKKTRNRLRKKLPLDSQEGLEDYVRAF